MAKCKLCSKSGWFLSLSSNGLCEDCFEGFRIQVPRDVQIIQKSWKLVENSKNILTKISRCKVIIWAAQPLIAYEESGIETLEPVPSELIPEVTSIQEELILEYVDGEIAKALEKSKTLKTKMNRLHGVLYKKMDKLKDDAGDIPAVEAAKQKVKDAVLRVPLRHFLARAAHHQRAL